MHQDRRGLRGQPRALGCAEDLSHLLTTGEDAARCMVECLVRSLGIRGVVRGKKVVSTNPDTSLPCPDDIGVSRRKSAFGRPPVQGRSAEQAEGSFIVTPLVQAQWTTTSPMCRRGPGRFMWPSLWMSVPAPRLRPRTSGGTMARRRSACLNFDEDPDRPRHVGANDLAKKDAR